MAAITTVSNGSGTSAVHVPSAAYTRPGDDVRDAVGIIVASVTRAEFHVQHPVIEETALCPGTTFAALWVLWIL